MAAAGSLLKNVSQSAWQDEGRSMGDALLYMLDHDIATDVRFKVMSSDGNVKYFSAHRLVLIANSMVFQCMFTGGAWREGSHECPDILVPDIEPHVFNIMLRYVYGDTAAYRLTAETAIHLMHAAKKYLLTGILKRCHKYLASIDVINADNVCWIFEHCMLLDEKGLRTRCMELIGRQAFRILNSADFFQLSRPALSEIVAFDKLNVPSELHVFNACVAWARLRILKRSSEITTKVQICYHNDSKSIDGNNDDDKMTNECKIVTATRAVNHQCVDGISAGNFATTSRCSDQINVIKNVNASTVNEDLGVGRTALGSDSFKGSPKLTSHLDNTLSRSFQDGSGDPSADNMLNSPSYGRRSERASLSLTPRHAHVSLCRSVTVSMSKMSPFPRSPSACAVEDHTGAKSATANKEPTDLEIRDELGPVLYRIRFMRMSRTELVHSVLTRDILTDHEKSEFLAFSKKKYGSWSAKVMIRQQASGQDVVSRQQVNYKSSGTDEPIRVELPSSVFIEGYTPYTLSVYILGPPSFHGYSNYRTASTRFGKFTFQTSTGCHTGTCSTRGQIPRLYYQTLPS